MGKRKGCFGFCRALLTQFIYPAGSFYHLCSSKCDVRDENVLICDELGCYSFVALGHEEDNASYLYLYLLSVSGKLLVSDFGSSKQPFYSALASAVLSHTGVLCPQKSQQCAM